MKASVIIINRNEDYLWFCLKALLRGQDPNDFEILIMDDGSYDPPKENHSLYPNVRVIKHTPELGIGWSFDRGVDIASGDTIILTAGDVIVKDPSWLQQALDYTANYRDSIGCSTCLSLDPHHLDPSNPADAVKRFGATILPFYTTDDLRSDSPVVESSFFDIGLFESKWIKKVPDMDITEVPSIYGAFYVTTKSWYKTIHGWDTVKNMKISGHKSYGGLEPWLGIKSWLYGGKCHALKCLETGHIFHKFERENSERINPNTREDFFWYNKFFIAYTMLPKDEADRLINKIYEARISLDLHTMQFNVARKLIQNNWDYVIKVREQNRQLFVHDFDWYCERFDILKRY
jgi:glycosyltransferase involved in cell wall biosynthesis